MFLGFVLSCSGGHINPAVSLGVFLNGQIGFVRLLVYWMAQLCGATVGAALVLVSFTTTPDEHIPTNSDFKYYHVSPMGSDYVADAAHSCSSAAIQTTCHT